MKAREHELRCFCRRHPLLATYGFKDNKLFVHVKIYKQGRIFGELVIEGGVVKIHCRECLRWHTVTFSYPKASLTETTTPPIQQIAG